MLLRRIANSDLESAPDEPWVESLADATNKLVDHASAPDKPMFIKLLQQADLELIEFDAQVPDPWYKIGTSPAPSFQNSYTGSGQYMKGYDGEVFVNLSVQDGVANTIFTLPVGFRPAAALNFIAWDNTTGVGRLLQVGTDGSVGVVGAGLHPVLVTFSFMPADVTPIIQSCFPVMVKTRLKAVAGVWVVQVQDSGSSGQSNQAQTGYATSVDFTTTMSKGQLMIKIKNVMGLPYNRKSHVKLLALGDVK